MKKNFYLFFSLLALGGVQAQSTSPFIINSMGGTGAINGNIYDWSFGEMTLVNTLSTVNLIVTQGVLQPRYDSIAMGINNTTAIVQNIKVYPNPAQNVICFESDYKTPGKLNYVLVDVAGKSIINKQVSINAGNNKQTIDLTTLPTGIYILKITATQENKPFMQTYKIQKIN